MLLIANKFLMLRRMVVVAVCGVFVHCVAFAATCPVGQYYECGEDPFSGHCTECECVSCPSGQTSDGWGRVDYCPDPVGDTGCHPWCQDYNECPNGIGGNNQKCKVITGADGCPSSSGCTKYELCNISNGAITYKVTSGCHLEGYRKDICQPNTVPCSIFSIDHFAIGWNCEQNTQVGEATWQPDKSAWDTKNCSCEFTNRDLTSHESPPVAELHCKSANARHHVLEAHRYSTTEVDSAVRYSFDWEYCSKCKAGYIPKIQPAVSNGIYLRPDHNGSWGVTECAEQVSAPYYTDTSKFINFSLPTGQAAIDDYVQHCPIGTMTNQDGATSASACTALNMSQRYQDETGIFTITSTAQCPDQP